jgi:hypothetical protein
MFHQTAGSREPRKVVERGNFQDRDENCRAEQATERWVYQLQPGCSVAKGRMDLRCARAPELELVWL